LLKYLGLPLLPDVLRNDRGIQKALIIRSIAGTICLVIFINALPLVPLGVLQTILQITPFWCSVLGWFMLGDRVSCFEVIAMVCSFAGIIMIISSKSENKDEKVVDNTSSGYMFGCFLMVLLSFGSGIIQVLIR
jgi:drug/metabolite transporter (DMT)-like permease